MSLELVNTLATFGTFLVIAGTAIAAIVQLRHARSSNQIEAIAELRGETESPQMQSAARFVLHDLSKKMEDPAFRYEVANRHRGAMTSENQSSWSEIVRVANFYETMGLLVKSGLADKNLVLDMFSANILTNWKRLSALIGLNRNVAQDNSIWENFEYLAVLSQDWEVAHPNGTYPAGVRRLELKYPWLEADKQYTASLAPA
jgi:Domain of unknown function (DUF4760)